MRIRRENNAQLKFNADPLEDEKLKLSGTINEMAATQSRNGLVYICFDLGLVRRQVSVQGKFRNELRTKLQIDELYSECTAR